MPIRLQLLRITKWLIVIQLITLLIFSMWNKTGLMVSVYPITGLFINTLISRKVDTLNLPTFSFLWAAIIILFVVIPVGFVTYLYATNFDA